MTGVKRIAVNSITYLMKIFPCVAILGARQIGKTTLLKQLAPKAPLFDLEKQSDFLRIQHDPDYFLSQWSETIAIDEAQILPDFFRALRVAIDANRECNGRFLLSGSSSPELLSKINESLAGRIAVFQLGGFHLEETWNRPSSKLYELIAAKQPEEFLSLKPKYNDEELLLSCLAGSYPQPALRLKDRQFCRLWMENYIQSYVRRDVYNLFPRLNVQAFQLLVRMLAASSGQVINIANLARSLDVSQPSVKNYLRIADGTFLWRNIPSFHRNVQKTVTKAPKGFIRDSGIICFLLGINSIEGLRSNPNFGFIWESFISEEIIKGFANRLISVTPYYYRTKNKAEIDLVLEGDFGLIPIEVKAGFKTEIRQLRALSDFINEQKCPFGIVVNNSKSVERLTNRIYQIPAACL